MRRFEFIGDGSEKFWEIGRDGAAVTVRFGRIGTNGQTQTKDLGTDAAAALHVAKLVAEKATKGYVEGTAAPGTAGTMTAPRVTAPVEASTSDRKDETAFTPPSMWNRQAEPFRGRRPAPRVDVDETTLSRAADLWQRTHDAIRPLLEHPSSDAALVERAERHATSADPLGAALLTLALCRSVPWNMRDQASTLVADELVLRHGAAFAAEAGASLASVAIVLSRAAGQNGHRVEQWIAPAPPERADHLWHRTGAQAVASPSRGRRRRDVRERGATPRPTPSRARSRSGC